MIDTVSRDGVHKCVAIWKYIKFHLNGVENVFYGQRLLHVDAEPHLRQMVQVRHTRSPRPWQPTPVAAPAALAARVLPLSSRSTLYHVVSTSSAWSRPSASATALCTPR